MAAVFNFDGEAVRKLAEILIETGLTEIEYEAEGNRIYVSRQMIANATVAPLVSPSLPSVQPQSSVVAAPSNLDLNKHPGAVRSPMVGTVYLASQPGADPFIKVGDTVSVGQTLLIVEAMKVMNPIKSPSAGKVTHIFAKDASPVEYDELLLVIEAA